MDCVNQRLGLVRVGLIFIPKIDARSEESDSNRYLAAGQCLDRILRICFVVLRCGLVKPWFMLK